MAVNVCIELHPSTKILRAAQVIARLNGNELTSRSGILDVKDYEVSVDDNAVFPTGIIEFRNHVIKDVHNPHRLWKVHYSFEGTQGYHAITMISTPWSCALGRRLIEIFGGRVDYNDEASGKTGVWDVEKEAPGPLDDVEFEKLLKMLKPISNAQMEKYGGKAQYGNYPDRRI